jgi:S-adenosyl-L-methionine hydrolase (adenosine-forming)
MTSYITLLSDFGLRDASVAVVKSVVSAANPQATIVDISHEVEPYYLPQAVYMLKCAYRRFPVHTCHVILMDVFSEKQPQLLLAKHDGHYFLSADNGLLSIAFGDEYEQVWECHTLAPKGTFYEWLMQCADIAAKLAQRSPESIGWPQATLRNNARQWQPAITQTSAECQVIHIDRYDNVVVNITKDQFEAARNGRLFRIEMKHGERLTSISDRYTDVREGELLCRFNSSGYLEICMNRASAAALLGLRLFRDKDRGYNTVKIFFE